MMSEAAKKKVDFILAWFRSERNRFSFRKQIQLAQIWIEICTKNEEYEMAMALVKEKELLMEEFLTKKRESRDWKQKLWYYYNKLKRKIFKQKKGINN